MFYSLINKKATFLSYCLLLVNINCNTEKKAKDFKDHDKEYYVEIIKSLSKKNDNFINNIKTIFKEMDSSIERALNSIKEEINKINEDKNKYLTKENIDFSANIAEMNEKYKDEEAKQKGCFEQISKIYEIYNKEKIENLNKENNQVKENCYKQYLEKYFQKLRDQEDKISGEATTKGSSAEEKIKSFKDTNKKLIEILEGTRKALASIKCNIESTKKGSIVCEDKFYDNETLREDFNKLDIIDNNTKKLIGDLEKIINNLKQYEEKGKLLFFTSSDNKNKVDFNKEYKSILIEISNFYELIDQNNKSSVKALLDRINLNYEFNKDKEFESFSKNSCIIESYADESFLNKVCLNALDKNNNKKESCENYTKKLFNMEIEKQIRGNYQLNLTKNEFSEGQKNSINNLFKNLQNDNEKDKRNTLNSIKNLMEYYSDYNKILGDFNLKQNKLNENQKSSIEDLFKSLKEKDIKQLNKIKNEIDSHYKNSFDSKSKDLSTKYNNLKNKMAKGEQDFLDNLFLEIKNSKIIENNFTKLDEINNKLLELELKISLQKTEKEPTISQQVKQI